MKVGGLTSSSFLFEKREIIRSRASREIEGRSASDARESRRSLTLIGERFMKIAGTQSEITNLIKEYRAHRFVVVDGNLRVHSKEELETISLQP